MKRKNLLWVFLGLVALMAVVSCKSKPAPQEGTLTVETPAPTPAPAPVVDTSPDRASLDALNSAAARAAAARQLIMDFEGPSFYPDDWQFAESLYSQAEQQKNTSTRDAVQESIVRYDRASAAFEAMNSKTFAAAYDYAERELTAVRNEAIAAGAQELIPDYFLEIDNTVLAAEDKYLAKDYYAAKDSAFKAFYMYDAMTVGLEAYNVREEITDRGFEVYDPQNFDLADDSLESGAYDYLDNDFASARSKAEDALFRYNLGLRRGWESYAAEKGADASTERQNALDEKANVAVRPEYNSAQAVFVRANSAFQASSYEEAASLYIESQVLFTEAARSAREKRLAAERALELANQKMAESDETARNAEVILEGGV